MATILAPYTDSMKLGAGFNSFTQELCIDHAVIRADETKPAEAPLEQDQPKANIAQSVVYKTSIVDKATDVTEALNINAAFTIKYDKLNADGKGKLVNTNTLKSSDLNYMISVKVVNEVIMDRSLTKFSPINGLNPSAFTSVYGDSFISGFQEGGEFTAIISIKVRDRDQLESIKAEAAVSLTMSKLEVSGNGELDKSRKDFLAENETTISVSWIGGGQDLKPNDQDWTFETMKSAALRFPNLVAKTPMRTHAILTRYTSLKSFQSLGAQFVPLDYEHAGNYTAALQEAYLDYKNIAKDIQVMAYDAVNGTTTLSTREGINAKDVGSIGLRAAEPALLANMTNQKAGAEENAVAKPADAESVHLGGEPFTNLKVSDSPKTTPQETPISPLVINQPYPATIFGLEAARVHCRFMMNRIVREVNIVSRNPEVAIDETRPMPYMSPFLFKLLLPEAKPTTSAIG